MTSARFDDLRPSRRRSFRLCGLVEEFAAHDLAAVRDVLDRAERAVAAGSWVAGFVAYEAAGAFDPAMVVRPLSGSLFADLPLAWFAVFERREHADAPAGDAATGDWTPTIDAARHAADVEAIRERIARGDTYQVNHTFRMSAPFSGEPADLYGRLARAQRGGYGALLEAGRWAVVSASPELFFEWSGGVVTCRPMKGTAPRGLDAAEDSARVAALLGSAKDRAENLMIVDMVRNDLSRLAVPGTVGVTGLFEAERFDTVWQLTSTVRGETPVGTSLGEVFAALFPSASITGAPRVSTMGIIAERETTPRGVYCGAIGFGGPASGGPASGGSGAEWAFNVGIRTVLVDRETGVAWYGTGGGVTYDSTPAGEFAEAVLKAEVLHRPAPDFSLLETLRWEPGGQVIVSRRSPSDLGSDSPVPLTGAESERRVGITWGSGPLGPDGFGLLERHLERLAASAAWFDIPVDEAEVRAALAAAVEGRATAARVRLLVDRDGGVSVSVGDAPAARTEPVRVAVDTVPVDSRDPFARHKTTRRAVYEAAAARHPDAEDVVLVNELGEVTETTIANIAAHLDGEWVTPPLSSGCLPGVMRAEALASGALVEGTLTPADLARADALVRLNALRGWEPVCGISA